jgi:hypothetical protein
VAHGLAAVVECVELDVTQSSHEQDKGRAGERLEAHKGLVQT